MEGNLALDLGLVLGVAVSLITVALVLDAVFGLHRVCYQQL
jgi:hypothetical protein